MWDSKPARRRGNSIAKGTPSGTRTAVKSVVQPKSAHVSDPFLQDFLGPSFDAAAYLNSTLPAVQPTSTTARSSQPGAPVGDVSTQAQTLLSQLNAHTTRLSGTLTQLTDDILRSGNRLAYEVELLRGETLTLSETIEEVLQDDIKKFVVSEPSLAAEAEGQKLEDAQKANGDSGQEASNDEPPYIAQLQTLTLVRSRLDSVIKTFGNAMDFVFPPSELSVSSSFLSVSAPEPGPEQHSTEEKGQQVLQSLRDEINHLLYKSDDPVVGIEKAAQRIEALKELATVWKGTAEEKGRLKFIESLAKMVEDRHRELLREVELSSRRDGKGESGSRPRNGSVGADGAAADPKSYSGGYGFITQLQKMRSGL